MVVGFDICEPEKNCGVSEVEVIIPKKKSEQESALFGANH